MNSVRMLALLYDPIMFMHSLSICVNWSFHFTILMNFFIADY